MGYAELEYTYRKNGAFVRVTVAGTAKTRGCIDTEMTVHVNDTMICSVSEDRM